MEQKFKGTYMSLGHFCATSEILSRIGVRESGIFDWAENRNGLFVFADVLSGAFQHNVEHLDWTTSLCYDTNDNGEVVESMRRVPRVGGIEFTHMPYHDEHWVKSELIKRAEKVRYFAKAGGKFVYACTEKEEPYRGYVLDMLDVWFEQHGYYTDDQLLMLPYGTYDDYYQADPKKRSEYVEFIRQKLIEHNKAPLTIRSDFVEKYNR